MLIRLVILLRGGAEARAESSSISSPVPETEGITVRNRAG